MNGKEQAPQTLEELSERLNVLQEHLWNIMLIINNEGRHDNQVQKNIGIYLEKLGYEKPEGPATNVITRIITGGKRSHKRRSRRRKRKKSGGVIEIPSKNQHTKTIKKILIETQELSKWSHKDNLSVRELEKKRSEAIELLKELKGKYKGDMSIGRRRRLSDGSVIGFNTKGDKGFKKKIKKIGKFCRAKLRKVISDITETIRRIKKEEGEAEFWNHEKITVTDLNHAAGPSVRMPAATGPVSISTQEGGKRNRQTRKKGGGPLCIALGGIAAATAIYKRKKSQRKKKRKENAKKKSRQKRKR